MSKYKYKCENHKLEICCLGCVHAWINRHDQMLRFIRKISELEGDPLDFRYYLITQAQELLNEIGR